MWSSRKKSSPDSSPHFVFRGRAYPSVVKGDNATRHIELDSLDSRKTLYNHPAVKLSDADLDKFNGTEGYPLWVEHKANKGPVGVVYHSWLGDGEARSLEIIGRVFTNTERGKKVAAKIQNGTYKGLSVNYGAAIAPDGRNEGTAKVHDKKFREISICKEPFFENCNIKLGIAASKKGSYKSEGTFYHLSIEATGEVNMSETATQQQPNTTQSSSSTQSSSMDAELLKQADSLKEQANTTQATLEKERQEKAELQKKLEALEAWAAREQEEYARNQLPKAQQYIAGVEASTGKTMSEKMKEQYMATFCNKQFKAGAEDLWAQHEYQMNVKASRDAAEKKAKDLEERLAAAEKEKEEVVSKATRSIMASRKGFSEALEQKPVDEKREEQVQRKVPLTHIMCAQVADHELPFLKQFGFGTDLEVKASADDDEQLRPLVSSIAKPPTHRLLLDPISKERNFPNSARYGDLSQQRLFAFMCSKEELVSGSLNDLVSVPKKYDIAEPKRDEGNTRAGEVNNVGAE